MEMSYHVTATEEGRSQARQGWQGIERREREIGQARLFLRQR
jgi:hypothetical protein